MHAAPRPNRNPDLRWNEDARWRGLCPAAMTGLCMVHAVEVLEHQRGQGRRQMAACAAPVFSGTGAGATQWRSLHTDDRGREPPVIRSLGLILWGTIIYLNSLTKGAPHGA